MANVIIIGGAGPKAFCAGGDVAALALQNASGSEGQEHSKAYFGLEYQLDHLIATYPKPYVAYMNGITMGGGVGLSVHAPFRIATENTIFSMPETSIGFFPDVGGSFFLPRLEGYIGTYLGLTSERLNGVNAFYTGIATHYIDSSSLPNLTARLSELEFKDYTSLNSRLSIIDATIEEFVTGIPHNEPMIISGDMRKAIDRCFRHNRMENILQALEEEKSGKLADWATRTHNTLLERSPTSLKVTLKQMRVGRKWDISEAFQREFHIASHFMTHPDFNAGVSARLIDKPPSTPKWNPSTLDEVKDGDVNEFFTVPKDGRRLNLMAYSTWKEYPAQMGLPREVEVEEAVRIAVGSGEKARNVRRRIVDNMAKQKGGKLGVKEKVEEVLQRNCGVSDHGGLRWIQEELSEL